MPFIWNDIEYKLIDDEEFEENLEEYDGFVVARRLYMTSTVPFPCGVSKYH